MPQEAVVWAADENEVVDVRDVVEVLDWAKVEARARNAIFTIYAVVDLGQRMTLVWLAGWDPTKGGQNYADRQPPDVDPVSGNPSDVYRSAGK